MAINIYRMNDCDWWATEKGPDDAILEYMAFTGCSREEATDAADSMPDLVPDSKLDQLQFHWDGDRAGGTISFRAALDRMIAEGQQFPTLFASTEF